MVICIKSFRKIWRKFLKIKKSQIYLFLGFVQSILCEMHLEFQFFAPRQNSKFISQIFRFASVFRSRLAAVKSVRLTRSEGAHTHHVLMISEISFMFISLHKSQDFIANKFENYSSRIPKAKMSDWTVDFFPLTSGALIVRLDHDNY